jgi:hypothetical protein
MGGSSLKSLGILSPWLSGSVGLKFCSFLISSETDFWAVRERLSKDEIADLFG